MPYMKQSEPELGKPKKALLTMKELTCARCGAKATHFTLDGADSKLVCVVYPKCKGAGSN